MTEAEAERALGILVGATPGPWTDATVLVWIDAFVKLDEPDLLHATCENLALHWTSQYRPSLGEIIEAYEARHNYRIRRVLPSTTHCDGSGWVNDGAGQQPCGRCNPALAEVFADSDKYQSWRTGTPLWLLDVGVEKKRSGQLRYIGAEPPNCHPAHDGGVFDVEANRGLAIAKAAYVEECRSLGHQPVMEHFTQKVEVVEVGPTKPRKPKAAKP